LSFTRAVPPKFTPPPSSTAVGIEEESLVIGLVASGNPTNIQYTWTKEGQPLEDHGEIALLKSERLREIVSLLGTGDEVEMRLVGIGNRWGLDFWLKLW
jgi:hypothetical protein